MIDLFVLVADKCMQAAVEAVLERPESLDIRPVLHEVVVHDQRDPGCFERPEDLLDGYRGVAARAIVMLDASWGGAPSGSGSELEAMLEERLRRLYGDWARAVVIEPELEAWVFGGSAEVPRVLGWRGSLADMRAALVAEGLLEENAAKPRDPKAALEWLLWRSRLPLSSSIFRELGRRVSLRRCEDRAFGKFRGLLREWFPRDR